MLGKADLIWTPGGPRSAQFDDVYFSAENGLAEAHDIFVRGAQIDQLIKTRHHITVFELGFGSGLNILALWQYWRQHRRSDQRLHIVSVEGYPMSRDEAARVHGLFPEITDLSQQMVQQFPPQVDGVHHMDFPDDGVRVDVIHQDMRQALENWQGRADAWFLDGFAPQKNQGSWHDDIFKLMAAKLNPGACVGTFTVAGHVRRGLAAAGFHVEKAPGFGRKRERLVAQYPGKYVPTVRPQSLAIIGAGIAGACVAHYAAQAGLDVTVYDGDGPAAGASGNPVALVGPRFDRGAGALPQFFAQSWRYANSFYERYCIEAIASRGILRLAKTDKEVKRFQALLSQHRYAAGELALLSPAQASDVLGIDIDCHAAWLPGGLIIQPVVAIDRLLAGVTVKGAAVNSLHKHEEKWQICGNDGHVIGQADAVCVSAGWGMRTLCPDLKLSQSLGQVSIAKTQNSVRTAASWGGYVIPMPQTGRVLFGATHDKGIDKPTVTDDAHSRNLAALEGGLPGYTVGTFDLDGRASIRASTPHALPVCGQMPDGMYVLGGLGARGMTYAPVLAQTIVSGLMGWPLPVSESVSASLSPGRIMVATETA